VRSSASFRIDRQLIGRSAWQGKAGSFQFFLLLEDELFRDGDVKLESLRRRVHGRDELPASCNKLGLDPLLDVIDD